MTLKASASFRPNGDMGEKIRQTALAKAQRKVHSLRCAEHGNSVSVALDGDRVNLSGWCCEKFRHPSRYCYIAEIKSRPPK